ncbi:hypothetical protein FIBSPDRAFT_954090 [Athelia psychrophila]|uniref:Uncharacterized protein n=1 Tax=Athelia psychrophila TaxID=1759441 RepID=A0A166JIJ9_9AGAM|nr:hypothetical protein FIBSPDRAFT_954090 [Fibularhizoctonia sp. CBS 109695]
MTSIVFRPKGTKIERRIYWTSSGTYCLDLELLELGDNCAVLGSRLPGHDSDDLIKLGDGVSMDDCSVVARQFPWPPRPRPFVKLNLGKLFITPSIIHFI